MCCCEESFWTSEGAQAELPPILETVEHALDDVAGFVEIFVIFELHLAVLARRDARGGFDVHKPVAQMVRVVSAVGNDGGAFADIGGKALPGLGDIRSVSRRQVQVNRATLTVAHQMQFRVQPAFGLADLPAVAFVFLTPLAAMRWVLTGLASIISVEKSAFSRARVSNTRSKTPTSDQRL